MLFLKKRAPGQAPHHAAADWLQTEPLTIEGVDIPINGYFLHHPDMVLGSYGSERTKVRKVSQRLLSVRRTLNLQGRDFHRLHNRPFFSAIVYEGKQCV